MNKKLISKFVREGEDGAEVEVEYLYTDEWSPYLSLQDAMKLDTVRDALRRGDIASAGKLAQVYKLPPLRRDYLPSYLVTRIQGRLSNESFVSKAPSNIIEGARAAPHRRRASPRAGRASGGVGVGGIHHKDTMDTKNGEGV